MPAVSFDRLPDGARVWIFGASRGLNAQEAEALLAEVDSFLQGWVAHGVPVHGARAWFDDRFLLVAADEEATGISGCSIDSLFRTLKQTERRLGLSLLDGSLVHYRDASGAIHSVSRPEFRAAVGRAEIGDATPVFDNTVASVGAIRAGDWEKPFGDSWHARAFAAAR